MFLCQAISLGFSARRSSTKLLGSHNNLLWDLSRRFLEIEWFQWLSHKNLPPMWGKKILVSMLLLRITIKPASNKSISFIIFLTRFGNLTIFVMIQAHLWQILCYCFTFCGGKKLQLHNTNRLMAKIYSEFCMKFYL